MTSEQLERRTSSSREGRALVQLENVSRAYRMGGHRIHALRDVNLRIFAGDFSALVGPSGSGKSTLLHLIGCLDSPDAGAIFVDGVDLSSLNEAERSEFHNRRVGFVFQSFNLVPVLNVFENVELPLLVRRGLQRGKRHARVEKALESVGLARFRNHRPDQLSGGQRQRVAIARALVVRPSIVLADEPTANLDSHTALQVVNLMAELNEQQGVTFLFSTHDERLMGRTRRMIKLTDGSIAD